MNHSDRMRLAEESKRATPRPDRPQAPAPLAAQPPPRGEARPEVSGTASVPWPARLGVRRTLIPILITLCLALLGIAIVGRASPPTAPLHLSLHWALLLTGAGLVLGVLASLNMLAVRRQLRRTPRTPSFDIAAHG